MLLEDDNYVKQNKKPKKQIWGSFIMKTPPLPHLD